MKYLKIKKNSDFLKLFRQGKKVFSPYLTLLYSPAEQISLGLAVSKKHGKAHVRNRIKRLCREAFAKNISLLPRGYSIIIIPKVRESYSLTELDGALKICFKKIAKCGN